MSSIPDREGNPLQGLSKDHKELRGMVESTNKAMSEMAQSQVRVEGKIDTLTALLSGLEGRQDRSEERIDRLDSKMTAENRRLDDKVNGLATKVWMGAGAIAFVSLIPALMKLMEM